MKSHLNGDIWIISTICAMTSVTTDRECGAKENKNLQLRITAFGSTQAQGIRHGSTMKLNISVMTTTDYLAKLTASIFQSICGEPSTSYSLTAKTGKRQ